MEVKKKEDALNHQQFIDENIPKLLIDVLERCLGNKQFNRSWLNRWESNITDDCLINLRKLKLPYKYIVSCTIMQKNGGQLHTANSCFWDQEMDTSCTIRWENKFMFCIVSIFCLAI